MSCLRFFGCSQQDYKVHHNQVHPRTSFEDKMTKTEDLEKIPKDQTLSKRNQFIGPSVTLFFKKDPLKIVRASGQYMYDEQGNQYLDCVNNVAHVGHCHPHVTRAAMEQMSLQYTNVRYLHDNLVLYAERLTSYFPVNLKVCYFVNSGSEAIDLSIRLARAYTKNKDVLCIDGAYHGNLTTTIDISPFKLDDMNEKVKKWVHVAPLPCSYRGEFTKDKYTEDVIGKLYADQVTNMIKDLQSNGRKLCSFVHESMISCGGQVVFPKGYLQSVYKDVRAAGGVNIADEVQVGFGRMGSHFWGFQAYGDVIPDIVALGKPIGNGHPIACVVTTQEIADSFTTEYFNTYGGNPVSIAVANAVLDIMEKEDLMGNAKRVGKVLWKGLTDLQKKYPVIGDLRGDGLFIGVDFVESPETKEPSGRIALYVIHRLKEEKIVMSSEGKYRNVLKIKPPMTMTEDNAKLLLEKMDIILGELSDHNANDTLLGSQVGQNEVHAWPAK